ncbi:hypothetical protein CAOG_09085 [Capsaspora owczarzaki ATCC 30864]|uniref:hypothetical protein n=1 Tax=Capsaspora owczarzaki (strain ATCC 30864) TaxID=595528 RepID=UPI000352564B|nr:hypothetical protein CAOG_09085 [Capsaspora owczarzaki ATCC 30864]|eukprot:XP_011270818.1 hypothetical protein CAOG_09085 [Capsaspora owczarzaki ATCC 30864]
MISLRWTQIGVAEAQAIAEALKENTTLTWLELQLNRIDLAGARAIAEALKVNTTVTRLYLNSSLTGDAGVQAIAEALRVNKTLSCLNLDFNQIGDGGAWAIAEALKVNTALTALLLEFNQIGDAGACAIAAALKANKTVTLLDLTSNCIGNLGSQAIDAARKRNCGCEVPLRDQINPLAFSLLPRLASAGDSHTVFGMLTSGLELENQPACLPLLPTEIAELIMDKAHYWQGVQNTNRLWTDERPSSLKVRLPQGDLIRVKAIQVLRDWKRPNNIGDCAFDLTVRDEKGAVQYECAVHPTFVNWNLALATIWPASHPIVRQMREGWQVQVQPSTFAHELLFESLYVGYVDRQ